MSQSKNVSASAGRGLPIFAAGLVLRFATDPGNTWGGIHTQLAGTILIAVSIAGFILALVLLVIAGALMATATKRF